MNREAQFYHFLSQNVFLTDFSPTHMGVVGTDRIFIVYENSSRIELYKVAEKLSPSLSASLSASTDSPTVELSGDYDIDAASPPSSSCYKLELTIPLFDVDIVQVIHCSIDGDGYFALHTANRLNKVQTVRVYTNWHSNCATPTRTASHDSELAPDTGENGAQIFSVRLAGELFKSDSFSLYEKIISCLNVLELGSSSSSPTATTKLDLPVQFVSCCSLSGALCVTLRNSKVLLYRYVRVSARETSPSTAATTTTTTTSFTSSQFKSSFAIDFIHTRTVALLEETWIPEMTKLSLDYIAFMSRTHFTLLRVRHFSNDTEEIEHLAASLDNRLTVESSDVHGEMPRQASRDSHGFPSENNVQIVFDSLFDSLPKSNKFGLERENNNSHLHSEVVFGVVAPQLACRFAVFNHVRHCENNASASEEFDLLVCRRFKSPQEFALSSGHQRNRRTSTKDTVTMQMLEFGSLRRRSAALAGVEFTKTFHFGFDIEPIFDRRTGEIIAHGLYILHAFELDAYLVDLRRDSLKLVPISHLNLEDKVPTFGSFSPGPLIRDISFCPQQDLIHILSSQSLETYSTHFHEFLSTKAPMNLCRTRSIQRDPLMVGSNRFLDQIAMLANEKFLFLISSGEGESSRHTLYSLPRPNNENIQRDIEATIEELEWMHQSVSSCEPQPNRTLPLRRLYKFAHSNSLFTYLYESHTQQQHDQLKQLIDKTESVLRKDS